MTQWQRFIKVFYDFSERCEDDYDIMVRALKIAGMDRRPNIIRKNIEEIEEGKAFCDSYLKFFKLVDHDTVVKAKRFIQLENGNQPTLF